MSLCCTYILTVQLLLVAVLRTSSAQIHLRFLVDSPLLLASRNFNLAFLGKYGKYPGSAAMEFTIDKTWDGQNTGHDPIFVTLHPVDYLDRLKVTVTGPFFNDPPNPGGPPGQPFMELWNYEVVEAFFLNDNQQYLEVELCPHGQHLVLMLKGRRQAFEMELPLTYTGSINGSTWSGEAYIPASYFPPKVSKFNAYAIHGSGEQRTYEAMSPVPPGKYKDPDFHNLDYFQPINFQALLPSNWQLDYKSDYWRQFMLNKTFNITKTWNDQNITHDPVQIEITGADSKNRVKITVRGPFFNDPPNPGGPPGQPFPGLWDYEVAEAFFLNDNNQYLELEFCPHGQYLVLLLKGVRNLLNASLPLEYTATITGNTWEGIAYIPASYFPPKVSKFNAYAIHGSDPNRVYEALYPTAKDMFKEPDFHRVQFFKPIEFAEILPVNWSPDYKSDEWQEVLNNS